MMLITIIMIIVIIMIIIIIQLNLISYNKRRRAAPAPGGASAGQACKRAHVQARVHPIRILRFWFLRTQPLANLAPLPITKRFLGNPTLGRNLGSRILGMRIGCTMCVRTLGASHSLDSCFWHSFREPSRIQVRDLGVCELGLSLGLCASGMLPGSFRNGSCIIPECFREIWHTNQYRQTCG